MKNYQIKLDFNDPLKGYIADPYWPEINTLINVQKESGLNRARSAAGRRKALEEWLRANGKTLQWYEDLEASTKRPFHTLDDGEIIIPPMSFLSFLVATCDTARAAHRPSPPDQVHTRFRVEPLKTGKYEHDGIWERFATVTSGNGAKLSNQRGLRQSSYIREFVASGILSFDDEQVDPKTLQNAIKWGGDFVGIGASRKLGWGRFNLASFEEVKQAKPDLKAA